MPTSTQTQLVGRNLLANVLILCGLVGLLIAVRQLFLPNPVTHLPAGVANAEDDPFVGPSDSTDKLVDFDELTKLIEDTVGEVHTPTEPLFDPPLNAAQTLSLVNQCIEQLFTNPDLAPTREFYGTAGSREVVLVNDGSISWPQGFEIPKLENLRLRFESQFKADIDTDRQLGVRLDKLDLRAPAGVLEENIKLTLMNVGGSRNGAVIGGCTVNFVVRKSDDGISAHYVGFLDP